ncbi:MAG: 30S ribosomal protein S19e [Candidatus Lokiarchaeota archaeon]|nr:30S ribosomal protein S19e [Candidatus Lokiarchaeota archaeon]
MVKVYDVPADDFINELKNVIKANYNEVQEPPYADFVKTGSFKEKPPTETDWWFIRTASILRKIYLKPEIGVQRLRNAYGGKKRGTHKPEHFTKSSGAIIRKILQQLEEAGLVESVKSKGRTLTNKGISLLDKTANDIKMKLNKEIPALQKYT